MDHTTRSNTGALPSTSRKRIAESDTESQPDASTQPQQKTHKRAKVAHDDASEVQVSTRVARAPYQEVRGSLKALLDVPLDVLEDIFLMCDPATLVNVARTNKAFCRLLQSPGYAQVWREAFACNEDIPEAPKGWTLVKWARLLFGGKECQSCLSPTVDTVSFGIRKRLCELCIRASMVQPPYEASCKGYKIYQSDFALVIPTASVKRDGTTSRSTYVYESDLEAFLRDQTALTMKVQDYMIKKKAKFRSRYEHALRAEKWQREQLKVRSDRHDEIMKRITLAGYDTKQDLTGFSTFNRRINIAQPLTKEDWTQLWSTMEPLLQVNKAKRLAVLAAGAADRLKWRREYATSHYDFCKDEAEPSPHKRCLWPSKDQILELEPLASFVECEADVESHDNTRPVEEWFDLLEGDILVSTIEVVLHVMRELDFDLARKALLLDASAEVDDPNPVLGLATSVFVVGEEETSASDEVYVYFGREVLMAARHHAPWLKDHPFSDPIPTLFSETGSAAVQLVLNMCKLKATTTILDLDARGPHFVCTACEPVTDTPGSGTEVQCREVLSWRTAVGHACQVHHHARNPVKLRFLTVDELAVLAAKTHKKPSQQASPCSPRIEHVVPSSFRCNHCTYELSEMPRKRQAGAQKGGYLTLKEVLKHVQEKHDITSSAAKEGVDYWYHPRLPRGLLNSTITDFRLIV